MTKTLEQVLKEVKSRALPINYRALSADVFGQLIESRKGALDERIVKGYAFMWGKPNEYGEVLIKGSCAKSIQDMGPDSNSNYKIKFRYQHETACALMKVLKEDDVGLYFETVPLDPIPESEKALIGLRSGTLNNFSGGWNYVWDKIEWDDQNEVVVLKEIKLYEVSVVDIPADKNTFAYRSLDDIGVLKDQMEDFIDTLPRQHRLEARRLFSIHTSLLQELEPLIQERRALKPEEPITGIDYSYLINNLKLSE